MNNINLSESENDDNIDVEEVLLLNIIHSNQQHTQNNWHLDVIMWLLVPD